MKNKEQLLNKENWVQYLNIADEECLTNNAKANDIVSKIQQGLTLPIDSVVGQSEQLKDDDSITLIKREKCRILEVNLDERINQHLVTICSVLLVFVGIAFLFCLIIKIYF